MTFDLKVKGRMLRTFVLGGHLCLFAFLLATGLATTDQI